MGLYPDRGLEYRVYRDDINFDIIIKLQELDNRLANSEYYKNNKNTWFDSELHYCFEGVNRKVEPTEIQDIIVTKAEQERIENAKKHKEYKEAGFYDVTYVSCTLN